jgi:hypothetical protein
MSRRVYLYFLITAVLGATLGGVGVYYFLWNTGRLQHRSGFNKDRALSHLRKELNLTDPQADQVGHIFDESSQKVRDLQKQIDPQFQAIHQETRAHIRQLLNSQQAQKFDELVKAVDERRRRRSQASPPAQ